MERPGKHVLGIKSTDFSDGLTVGSRGKGVLSDDIQVSGFDRQWMAVPLVELGKDGRRPCVGDSNVLTLICL